MVHVFIPNLTPWGLFPFPVEIKGKGRWDEDISLSLQYGSEVIRTSSGFTSAVSSSGGEKAKTLQESPEVSQKLGNLAFERTTNT